jgi:hypothetical protein
VDRDWCSVVQGSLAPVRQCTGGEGDRRTKRKKGKDDGEGGFLARNREDLCGCVARGKEKRGMGVLSPGEEKEKGGEKVMGREKKERERGKERKERKEREREREKII